MIHVRALNPTVGELSFSKNLLRRTTPSPNLYSHKDVYLALGSGPFYAHCGVYQLTQHCWMKVVLLEFIDPLYRGCESKVRGWFKGCYQTHAPRSIILIAVPQFLELHQRSEPLGSLVLYLQRLWEKCKYYAPFAVYCNAYLHAVLGQPSSRALPNFACLPLPPLLAAAHSAPAIQAFLYFRQTKLI